ncbi:MAG: nucleotide-binding protein [Candidatus Scalindua rubra]|uniref:Putative nucleotide-binding protein containing TIR-like domain protein n=1 Tax=Candidatus Scalindua brodae TaxID=237368 RepID=A0A0B0EK05_9BACT|nr:MAG: putative nucleotide-binding protein containing TIR-like domain protein [Candidatus Scalindua brodae]MBZ0110474.1 nucleotide-binding protein [Candidatus Scalindua rubra]TWU36309.1 putative nucleotide-binding protein containing TIR-like domain protein [Candidatus Brocadiaceae bacterium S225]
MNLDEVKGNITSAGYTVTSEERLGNNTGTKIKVTNGAILNLYDNGTLSFQGKNTEEIKKLFEQKESVSTSQTLTNEVFIVYGHDITAKAQLEAMLRRWSLEPLILDQLPSEGQTITEKLEKYTDRVKFAVVLATPDDEGHRANRPDEKAYRARQNVVLELGMLLKQLGRKSVAIILKQQENMERPSDIQGLIYIPFRDDLQKEAGPLTCKGDGFTRIFNRCKEIVNKQRQILLNRKCPFFSDFTSLIRVNPCFSVVKFSFSICFPLCSLLASS